MVLTGPVSDPTVSENVLNFLTAGGRSGHPAGLEQGWVSKYLSLHSMSLPESCPGPRLRNGGKERRREEKWVLSDL